MKKCNSIFEAFFENRIISSLRITIGVSLCLTTAFSCTKIHDKKATDPMSMQRASATLATDASTDTSFTIALLPDTQGYTDDFVSNHKHNLTEQQQKDSQLVYLNGLSTQIQYLITNRTALNLKYVIGLGDIVEHSDSLPAGYQIYDGQWTGNQHEWDKAKYGHSAIDPSLPSDGIDALMRNQIPFGLAVGNHDMFPHLKVNGWDSRVGIAHESTTIGYNAAFGKNYINRNNCYWYGGSFDSTNNNHYDLLTVGGEQFIFIYLQYDTSGTDMPEVRTVWLDSLLGNHPDYHAVIVTHAVVDINGAFSNQAKYILETAKQYGNVFLMLGGHYGGPGGVCEVYRDTIVTSNNGMEHTIRAMTSDYQDKSPKNGNGLLRLLRISLKNNDISVKTYSDWTSNPDYGYKTSSNSQFNTFLFGPRTEIPNDTFQIVNVWSKKVVSVEDASIDPGAVIMQRTWNAWDNQKWIVSRISNTCYYKIVNVNSKLALSVAGASKVPKDSCVQYSYTSSAPYNDQWALIPAGDSAGYKLYRVIARHDSLSMQVANASQAEHARIRQNDYHAYRNELFYFLPKVK